MGGLCAVGGIGLLVPGKQQLARMPLVPQATVETMKENMQWIKDQARTNGPSWSTTGNWPRRQMSRFMWPLGVGKAIISMPILTLEPSSRFRGSVSGNTTTAAVPPSSPPDTWGAE